MKTFVAIPCQDHVPVGFVRSLIGIKPVGLLQFTFAQGSLVYDARNQLANMAIDGGFDRVLWLDSDMEFPPELLEKLSKHLDDGKEIVSGLYFSRKHPIRAVAYEKVGMDGNGMPCAESIHEWPKDGPFRIEACGFGAVLHTVDLLKRIRDKFKLPFSPILGFGEDLSFCLRAKDLGAKIWCDPTIRLGHIGQTTFDESSFLMGMQKNNE